MSQMMNILILKDQMAETMREQKLGEMVDKALVVGTRLKRRLSIDKKMIERRDDRIAELTGKLDELESETTREEARMCMELGRLVNILESSIHPDILNREEETQVNEFTGNF